MLQEEHEVHEPYSSYYQQALYESVSVPENPIGTHTSSEQDTSPLPLIPSAPHASLPPQNRQGRGGAILLFTLVLAIMRVIALIIQAA